MKVITPPDALKSSSDFCDYLFHDEPSISKEITDTFQYVNTNELHLNLLFRSDSYTIFIKDTEVMDIELGESILNTENRFQQKV